MRPHHTAPPQPTPDGLLPGSSPGDLVGPFEVTLAAEADAPAAARAAVAEWMAARVAAATLADAQLLVVELVTNSVRHADAPAGAVVSVRAEIRGDTLHLEVEDHGRGGSVARRAPDLHRGGGFGLNLVDALSRRWGVDRDAGTRVWAELGTRAVGCGAAGRSVVPAGSDGDMERDAARAVQLHADETRRRGVGARGAGESAGARRARHRVALLHAAMARHHDAPWTPPRGGDPDAA